MHKVEVRCKAGGRGGKLASDKLSTSLWMAWRAWRETAGGQELLGRNKRQDDSATGQREARMAESRWRMADGGWRMVAEKHMGGCVVSPDVQFVVSSKHRRSWIRTNTFLTLGKVLTYM